MQDEALLMAYFREIKGASGLSAQVEQELSARAVTGDDEAIAKLVEGNLQFVVFVAKQYRNRGLPLSDLISAGNLGLIEGAKRFDGTKGRPLYYLRGLVDTSNRPASAEAGSPNRASAGQSNRSSGHLQ